MRTIVRGHTKEDCKKARDIKLNDKNGWKAITEVIRDDSLAYIGEISYVCVLERPDDPNHTGKNRKWNHRLPTYR